jgi:hypothetical protein
MSEQQVTKRTEQHEEGEEEVVEYMEQMDGSIHPAFKAGLDYESKTRRWIMKKDKNVEMCVPAS